MSSILYQLSHPWHWLTYGGNASGLASLVALAFGIPTLLYLVKGSRLSAQQAELARFQTQIAELTLRQQTRPIFDLERRRLDHDWKHNDQSLALKNIGPGVATEVVIDFVQRDPGGEAKSLGSQREGRRILAPGMTLFLNGQADEYDIIRVYCRSVLNHEYVAAFALLPQLKITHYYDSFEAFGPPSEETFVSKEEGGNISTSDVQS